MPRQTAEPTSIGDYDVLARIGEGGAGVVYKARHRVSEAIVAVKVLLPQQAGNRVLLKRFEQEFRAARPLNHPHLVRAFDFQEADGRAFLVMEYIEGRSLGERLEQGGRLPLVEAIRVVSQIAQAIDWLHDQGILHRDVKPDNVIVSPDGSAKLTDLGLVKELLLDKSLTRTGAALGTPNFMAPEQFRDAKRVDRRCDVYALAASFYQMVTGEIPFRMSGPFDAWVKKTKNDFTPPRELVRNLPPGIDRAICRGMNSDPNLRPATCAKFVADLVGATEPIIGTDCWELVFENSEGVFDPLRADTSSIRQLLKSGHLRDVSHVLARRSPGDTFEPLGHFPEFRDAQGPVARETPPPPTAQPDGLAEPSNAQPAAVRSVDFWAVIAAVAFCFVLAGLLLRF